MFSERFLSLPIREKVKYGIYSSLFLLTLALAGCGGENGTFSANSDATPVPTATPVHTVWEVVCQTDVKVLPGDNFGNVVERAQNQDGGCSGLSYQDGLYSLPDGRNANFIDAGEIFTLKDFYGTP